MAEEQYYTKVSFEYGVENADGTQEIKNTGNFVHVSMPYQHAVMLQKSAILPAWKMMMDAAMKLGEIKAGIQENSPPGQLKK